MAESPTGSFTQTREHPRYEVSIPVDCSTRDAFVSNHVCNISRGGLFIQTESPLPLHSEVSLVLRLPGSERCIRATGRVIWNYDMPKGTARLVPGNGIRFLDLPPSDRATLESFLRDLAPKAAESH